MFNKMKKFNNKSRYFTDELNKLWRMDEMVFINRYNFNYHLSSFSHVFNIWWIK